MREFVKGHVAEITIFAACISFLNIYKLCFHVIGVDTELALMDFESSLNWTLGSGRFASAFFRKLVMPGGFNYDMALLYLILGWLCVCLGYIYCLEKSGLKNRFLNFFFSAVFVSCPIWCEQNYFLCSMFINVYGIVTALISAYLFLQCLTDKGNRLKCVGAVVTAVIAIGIYQALLYLLAADFVMLLTWKYYLENKKISGYIQAIFKFLGFIVVCVGIYFAFAHVSRAMFYKGDLDYAGYTYSSNYVSSNISWLSQSFTNCIENIKKEILLSFDKNNTYGIVWYPITFMALEAICVIRFAFGRERKASILILGGALMLPFVFAGSIIKGNLIAVREQFVLPLFITFCVCMTAYTIIEWADGLQKSIRKAILGLLIALCTCITLSFSGKQLLINRTDYVRYELDVTYADSLAEKIRNSVGDFSQRKIIFIGSSNRKLPEAYLQGQVIGGSIFAWDSASPSGVNYRSYAMMNACGYGYIKPSLEEIQHAFEQCEKTDVFSSEEIVLYDDTVMVNLNML